ncbi:hypothetical protein DEA8626_00969 [Defluviimonas aquaemixtae]|uniref:Flagellar motor switch protein FliN-like C-terminal domain-containing protein n=1 Tax=Albidovulum aquaemixtae TaxID=1542388 RepID=A0A2R8B4C6_9RHOB|nr:FliM/FliN family flagellar motor switch protein [Defluviimonas aquaemixtae]SPH17447.1 hypothetical protein DEA8626_00969 [Defluviimonas aquaemixtae]
MTEATSKPVLKRMAEAGRSLSGGGTVTPVKVLGQALAKAAQDMLKLPVKVAEATDIRMALAEMPERLPERALLAVLEGPGEGLGLAALSPETTATLIEMQTTGQIGAAEVASRKPTRTDATMSARIIDRVLEEMEVLLGADPAIAWVGGFRYASFLDDPRPLGLLLEDTIYRAITLTLDFGVEGARRGTLLLLLPADGKGAPPLLRPDGAPVPAPGAGAAAEAEWRDRMEGAVLGARAQLTGVLDRVSLPLSAVLALKPGAVVQLSKGALTRVRVEGRGNRFLAWGKLGQCQGSLAVRLMIDAREEDSSDDTAAGPSPAADPALKITRSAATVTQAPAPDAQPVPAAKPTAAAPG